MHHLNTSANLLVLIGSVFPHLLALPSDSRDVQRNPYNLRQGNSAPLKLLQFQEQYWETVA